MGDAPEQEISLDAAAMDELSNPVARALLDTIDSLRELQIGEIVNLPQIIVVGDQSSGKSSVLEAISSVRFPTKGDLCTRFATELVMRCAPQTKIVVRTDPAGDGPSQNFYRTTFNKYALLGIIKEATEKMGIRVRSSKGFSKDVLRVEIAGPHVEPLTLVDLPGFFHSETEDQTQEGKEIVQQLAERYMKQPKSIILAVVAANNNLANQIVVEEARKHDPKRERTLGVITKPDLAAPGSQDEKKCLQLARAQESMHKLKLGWHVLRNRPEGKEEMSADDRDAYEDKFFQTGAWSHISPTSRGISSLRKKLSKVLLGHIQKTLPGLIEEIECNLTARQRALEQLGKPRSAPEDLRTYMLEIAEKFQRLARDGAEGRYGDEFFGDLSNDCKTRKLRAVLRILNRAFHATLVTKGVDRMIEWEDDNRNLFNGRVFGSVPDGVPEYLRSYLDLFNKFPKPAVISEMNLHEELEQLAAANQGNEFPGQPNGNIGFQLFKMQIRPWADIAGFYLNQVISFAKSFVEQLFLHVIGGDTQTSNAVLLFCVDKFFDDKQRILKDKLQEILRPYKSGYGPPLDVEFHATLLSTMVGRDAGRIASLIEEKFPAAFTDKGGKGLVRDHVEQALHHSEKASASEFGIERVVDMTMTHFQISLGTFAHNMVNLAVENCLISDLQNILTPSMVMQMSNERLEMLASESEAVQAERYTLQHEVNILTSGLRECTQCRPHQRTVLPEAFTRFPTGTLNQSSESSDSS
ncbi:uncharacterized protein JN550_003368 [Neoarthrinium moseri]|uniref:uncharacterized protein n=1 Tax=Neoarthrinium moseri TaxID=1658444 RepID=UPI001FDAF5A2|nr:uncharacterized protein JN550_003368 [Neoarthrinium moseri]KAI1873115.1 hypothetical protein JN550_003368 [Neoarthrinium moseri]